MHEASRARRLAKRRVDPSLPVEPQTVFPYVDIPVGPDPLGMSIYESASLTEIKFDANGTVLSPNQAPSGLSGHLTEVGALILASGNSPTDLLYELGIWYTGRSGEDIAFAPAICSRYDMESRYLPGHRPDGWEGGFGCREFGYYLRSEDHPYIDVTSYEESGPYIRPFIGWGRFDIAPKPIIGNHLGTWVCLYECPDGQKPGIIPNIDAWASKRGWPVPKPPKQQPLFPDPKGSPGSFVD
jgi:hypothetical protein